MGIDTLGEISDCIDWIDKSNTVLHIIIIQIALMLQGKYNVSKKDQMKMLIEEATQVTCQT